MSITNPLSKLFFKLLPMKNDPLARALKLGQLQELGEMLNKSLKKERKELFEFLNKQKELNAKIKRSYPKPELV
jgi:hypothetical protein